MKWHLPTTFGRRLHRKLTMNSDAAVEFCGEEPIPSFLVAFRRGVGHVLPCHAYRIRLFRCARNLRGFCESWTLSEEQSNFIGVVHKNWKLKT